MEQTTIKILVTVKAYPGLSVTYGETVCVAGIQVHPPPLQWIRLYPVPFRSLPYSQQFRQYAVISAIVSAPRQDKHPESRHADPGSLQVVEQPWPTSPNNWAKRLSVLKPLMKQSLCEIQGLQAQNKTSLGIFKPAEVTAFTVTPGKRDWDPRKHLAQTQLDLFGKSPSDLQKIPWEFHYVFRCDAAQCPGHRASCIDWELGQAYRNFLQQYGQDEVFTKLRAKWLNEMCGPNKDTYFIVGNMWRFPRQFLVLGVVWPKRSAIG